MQKEKFISGMWRGDSIGGYTLMDKDEIIELAKI